MLSYIILIYLSLDQQSHKIGFSLFLFFTEEGAQEVQVLGPHRSHPSWVPTLPNAMLTTLAPSPGTGLPAQTWCLGPGSTWCRKDAATVPCGSGGASEAPRMASLPGRHLPDSLSRSCGPNAHGVALRLCRPWGMAGGRPSRGSREGPPPTSCEYQEGFEATPEAP